MQRLRQPTTMVSIHLSKHLFAMSYFHGTQQCIGYDDRMVDDGCLDDGCLDAHTNVCIACMPTCTLQCYMMHLGMHTPMLHDACLHAHSKCIPTLRCTRAFAYLGTHTELPPYIKILPDSVHVGANSIFVARQVNGWVLRVGVARRIMSHEP